jgi:hypothetical protein
VRLFQCCVLVVAVMSVPSAGARADDGAPSGMAAVESSFLSYLDARDALALVDSGLERSYLDRDRAQWQALASERRHALSTGLDVLDRSTLSPADAHALRAMRELLAALDAEENAGGAQERACRDAGDPSLDYAALRAALVSCYVEIGNVLRFEGHTVDRGTALQLLHVIDEPERRKALFDAFRPLWAALYGDGGPTSPYRRLIAMASEDARRHGSAIDAAARSLGLETREVEAWLVGILDAWRRASDPQPVEPWDYRYRNSAANRRLAGRVPPDALLPISRRYYADLGADLTQLDVLFDLAPRAGKSPLAYTDFLSRGQWTGGQWHRPTARVVGTYPEGGLFSLNELVHEDGHAVHVSAIRSRPAYMDWPDTLFTEAFADVPSWSVYEPAWQRHYLGEAAPEADSMRALYGDVMLDVAWALFELRLLRDPGADPNVVWTDITNRYLHVVPHPEVPWWAMRVQLVDSPGYMVNYGLGAVLTAEMREQVAAGAGGFDTGNPRWYGWVSDALLRWGSERDARSLMQGLLGRPVSPDALMRQVARCGRAASAPQRPSAK